MFLVNSSDYMLGKSSEICSNYVMKVHCIFVLKDVKFRTTERQFALSILSMFLLCRNVSLLLSLNVSFNQKF